MCLMFSTFTFSLRYSSVFYFPRVHTCRPFSLLGLFYRRAPFHALLSSSLPCSRSSAFGFSALCILLLLAFLLFDALNGFVSGCVGIGSNW